MLNTYMSVICLKNSLTLVITSWPYLNWKMWSTNFGTIYQGECIQQHSSLIPSQFWVYSGGHAIVTVVTQQDQGTFACLHDSLSVCHWLLPVLVLIGVSLSELHTTRLYCACAYVYCVCYCVWSVLFFDCNILLCDKFEWLLKKGGGYLLWSTAYVDKYEPILVLKLYYRQCSS